MNAELKILSLVFLFISILSCTQEYEIKSPSESLNYFYTYEGAEDQLMDPLIVAGQDVIPLIIQEIKHKDMPRRRYAIGALGNLQDESAIPSLELLLKDSTEKDYFRCDALNAISLINFKRAEALSSAYRETEIVCLKEMSQSILSSSKEEWVEKAYMVRSRADAINNRHQ